ncbi:MAG: TetR/AcrR family transcriptional regulator [Candidatus Dormibacteria bacterium]
MRTVQTVARTRLSRDDWTAAGLVALAEGGMAAVAIEPLAARLGATKGSGYWHFANRAALVEATLQRWEREHTEMVIAEVERHSGAVERLRTLLHAVMGHAGPQAVELALLASADDPMVAPILCRVTERRISYLTRLFREMDFDDQEAGRRALLAYTTYLGHAQLARTAPRAVPRGSARQAYLDSVLTALTGD